MPKVFVGNFDFEHELADERFVSPAHVREITAELVLSWVTVAHAEDVIWSPGNMPRFDLHEFQSLAGWQPRVITREPELPLGPEWELVPWGWTDSILKWAKQFGWTCRAPAPGIVKQMNSRAYRWELESLLKVALPNSSVLNSIEQTVRHIEQFGARFPEAGWVLKANFGMAGRERQLGRGSSVSVSTLNWAKRRLQQNGSLVFEPWLERIVEAGIQVEVPQDGTPFLLGVLPLLTDSTGTYRGSRIQCQPEEIAIWDSAVDVAIHVACEVQRAGYFGPLGIDAMCYRDGDGNSRIRPLQDLNARQTMGRLALGLRRFIESGRDYDWIHDVGLPTKCSSADSSKKIRQITSRSWLVGCP